MKKSKTKQKTDLGVKTYKSLLVPESLHVLIKECAYRKGQRLNEYVPKLIKKALKIKVI